MLKNFFCFLLGAAAGYAAAKVVDCQKKPVFHKAENLSSSIDKSLEKLELKVREG